MGLGHLPISWGSLSLTILLALCFLPGLSNRCFLVFPGAQLQHLWSGHVRNSRTLEGPGMHGRRFLRRSQQVSNQSQHVVGGADRLWRSPCSCHVVPSLFLGRERPEPRLRALRFRGEGGGFHRVDRSGGGGYMHPTRPKALGPGPSLPAWNHGGESVRPRTVEVGP